MVFENCVPYGSANRELYLFNIYVNNHVVRILYMNVDYISFVFNQTRHINSLWFNIFTDITCSILRHSSFFV